MTVISGITAAAPSFAAAKPRFSSTTFAPRQPETAPPQKRSLIRGLFEGYFTEVFAEKGIRNLQKDEHGRRHPLRAMFWFALAFIFGRKAFADILGRKLGSG